MPSETPTRDEIERAAAAVGLEVKREDVDFYARFLPRLLEGFQHLDSLPGDPPSLRSRRGPVTYPRPQENPCNAWFCKVRVDGAPTGRLRGKRVVLKDNIMLAGVPMMNGTSLLAGYVAEVDATVVTRILDAGGEIVGKAHCEAFCMSGGSHTNATGPVHNPLRHGYSAGGSSSGCAVLVAAGEVEMAIGGDQGGSIRVPSSFCGTYGMKPTHGLVPYTGIVPMEATIDHAGPITASVRDNALLLEVIAGSDGLDSRQYAPVVHPYSSMLDGGVAGMRLGLVREGFSPPSTEADVSEKVRAAAARFGKMGAIVEEVSIPLHTAAGAASGAIIVEGVLSTILFGDGFGSGREGLYVPGLIAHLHEWKRRADELPETMKLIAILAQWVRDRYGLFYYAKAMNFVRVLRRAYDDALARFDLLLMPTTPMKATPLPGPGASREEIIARAFEPTVNTQPFDNTHHPAMSIPCGKSDGLPVGLMLIGKQYDEPTIYRAAYAFEQGADWRDL